MNNQSLGNGAAIAPSSEIMAEIFELDLKLGILDEALKEHALRLVPIKKSIPDSNGSGCALGNTPEAMLSPIGESIRSSRKRIEAMVKIAASFGVNLAV